MTWFNEIWKVVRRRGFARRQLKDVEKCGGELFSGLDLLQWEASDRQYYVAVVRDDVYVYRDPEFIQVRAPKSL